LLGNQTYSSQLRLGKELLGLKVFPKRALRKDRKGNPCFFNPRFSRLWFQTLKFGERFWDPQKRDFPIFLWLPRIFGANLGFPFLIGFPQIPYWRDFIRELGPFEVLNYFPLLLGPGKKLFFPLVGREGILGLAPKGKGIF